MKDPAVLLRLADSANSLEDAKTGAWHLKARFESFDANGKPLDKGTFEEWHLGPEKAKRIYDGAQFKQTEYVTPEGKFYESDAGAPTWPLPLIAREVSHPMAEERSIEESAPELRPYSVGSAKLSCVMLTGKQDKKTAWPLGRFPTYCFSADNDVLRLTMTSDGLESVRNQIVIFHNAYLGKEIAFTDSGRPLLRIHVADIAGLSENEAALIVVPTPAKALQNLPVSYAAMHRNKSGGPVPQYPPAARENRIHGRVVLKAQIGTDGRIHQLKVVSSPDASLSEAAVQAVSGWTYKPYTVNGMPVSVETMIAVVYRVGP